MRGLTLLVLALAAAALPDTARAEVVVEAGVPFTAAELEDALAARAPAPADVRVSGAAGEVQVSTAAGTWRIALGRARGASAARIVALHVVSVDDAWSPAPPPPRPAPPVPPARTAAAVATDPVDTAIEVVTVAPGRVPLGRAVAFRAGATMGAQDGDLGGGMLAVELQVTRPRWLVAGELALQLSRPSGAGAGEPVRARSAQLRLGAGVRRGPFALVAGPFIGLRGVDPVPAAPAALVLGVGTSARWQTSLGGAWAFELAAGADAYQHRVVVRAAGEPIAATPRVAFATTMGVSRVLR